MKIIEIRRNNLLNREEITAVLESQVTPSNQEVIQLISENTKKPADQIVIEKINSNFGTRQVKINVKVYNDLKSKEKFETVTRKAKKKTAEDSKKAEEAKKAADAEEAKKIEEAEKTEEVQA
jgi:ribosomal protein S24E